MNDKRLSPTELVTMNDPLAAPLCSCQAKHEHFAWCHFSTELRTQIEDLAGVWSISLKLNNASDERTMNVS